MAPLVFGLFVGPAMLLPPDGAGGGGLEAGAREARRRANLGAGVQFLW